MGQLLSRCTNPSQGDDGDAARPSQHAYPGSGSAAADGHQHAATDGARHDRPVVTDAPPARSHNAPPAAAAAAARASLKLDTVMGNPGGVATNPADLMFCGALRDKVRSALPPTQQHHWKLLYCSRTHGKNFTQMLKRTRKRGPTVIVVHEGKSEFGESGRVFGGYTNDAWRLVSDREHDAKVNAAARVRSARCEAEGGGPGEDFDTRPQGQARQFFGSAENFVFTSGDLTTSRPTAGNWASAFDDASIRLYRPKITHSSTGAGNANYQYLMDTHPQTERVGIGMGSDRDEGVGEFAWFLNRYLSAGRCCPRLCPTYGNPRLTSASDFGIADVEVYGVDGDAIDEDDLAGDLEERDERTLAERHSVDQALMELHGTKFYADEGREDCC